MSLMPVHSLPSLSSLPRLPPLPRLPLAAIASVALLASGARAEAAPAAPAAEGVAVGSVAQTFTLPVVNEFAGGKKWGPARWTVSTDAQKPNPDQKKLIVMSFFATYCEPCKKEMPELARLYDAYKDQGLGVMLVSIDKGDEQKQQIIDLAKQSKVAFPVMHDRFQVVARRYFAERLPYMLMIDGQGTVKTVHIGYTEELKAGLENEIRAGLGLPALEPPRPAVDGGAKEEAKDTAKPPKDKKKKPAAAGPKDAAKGAQQ